MLFFLAGNWKTFLLFLLLMLVLLSLLLLLSSCYRIVSSNMGYHLKMRTYFYVGCFFFVWLVISFYSFSAQPSKFGLFGMVTSSFRALIVLQGISLPWLLLLLCTGAVACCRNRRCQCRHRHRCWLVVTSYSAIVKKFRRKIVVVNNNNNSISVSFNIGS